eukprot:1853958-Prymnesium_polylepis.1
MAAAGRLWHRRLHGGEGALGKNGGVLGARWGRSPVGCPLRVFDGGTFGCAAARACPARASGHGGGM